VLFSSKLNGLQLKYSSYCLLTGRDQEQNKIVDGRETRSTFIVTFLQVV
jgi:hypothetical protein